jgi:hypothetical protein
LEVVLSVFGPFSKWICHSQILLKNASINQQTSLLLAMTIVKYLSIFVLKNPAAVDAQFWNAAIVVLTTFCKFKLLSKNGLKMTGVAVFLKTKHHYFVL